MTSLHDRLLEKVSFEPNSGCWLWEGGLSGPPVGFVAASYGTISVRGRMKKAHRVAYELFVGPIPEGLQLDHLCRTAAQTAGEAAGPVCASIPRRGGDYERREAAD